MSLGPGPSRMRTGGFTPAGTWNAAAWVMELLSQEEGILLGERNKTVDIAGRLNVFTGPGAIHERGR